MPTLFEGKLALAMAKWRTIFDLCGGPGIMACHYQDLCAKNDGWLYSYWGSAGSPAGSYALSEFDNVNLFNGALNFNLPLLKIGWLYDFSAN